jgi:hypothetical protein
MAHPQRICRRPGRRGRGPTPMRRRCAASGPARYRPRRPSTFRGSRSSSRRRHIFPPASASAGEDGGGRRGPPSALRPSRRSTGAYPAAAPARRPRDGWEKRRCRPPARSFRACPAIADRNDGKGRQFPRWRDNARPREAFPISAPAPAAPSRRTGPVAGRPETAADTGHAGWSGRGSRPIARSAPIRSPCRPHERRSR